MGDDKTIAAVTLAVFLSLIGLGDLLAVVVVEEGEGLGLLCLSIDLDPC